MITNRFNNLWSVISLLFLTFTTLPASSAPDFNEKQRIIIYNEALKVLQQYEQLHNQMADDIVNLAEVSKTSQKIIDLFISRKSIVYNDLDPAHQLSEAYELETYMANMELWYPDGLKITIDRSQIKAGEIIAHENNIFTIDLLTTKKMDGNYLNKTQNNNTEELLFRIAFVQKDRQFEKFRIAGIRSSKNNAADQSNKLLAEVRSVDFSEKDLQLIHSQVKFVLNDYLNYLKLLTDPNEYAEDKVYYGISFTELFKDSTLTIANDIEPDPVNRYITVSEYKSKIVSDYPEGVKNMGINVDSATFSKVIPENETFYINCYIDKFFAGKHQGKSAFRNNARYDFKLTFERDENTFKNFKIASIDKYEANLYENTTNEARALPQNTITGINRKGLHLGGALGGGISMFNDDNLSTNPLLKWETANHVALSAEAGATWYFNNRMGISTGIAYQRFAATLSINGTFVNNEYQEDVNGDLHMRTLNAAYDSVITFNYIAIPVSFTFHSSKSPEKAGFMGQIGLVAAINASSGYTAKGNWNTSGYYEQNPLPLQIIDAPEFGFTNRNNINEIGKARINDFTLGARIMLGYSMPISYFTTLYFGPEINISLLDLQKNEPRTDEFDIETGTNKVQMSYFSLKIGLTYKL